MIKRSVLITVLLIILVLLSIGIFTFVMIRKRKTKQTKNQKDKNNVASNGRVNAVPVIAGGNTSPSVPTPSHNAKLGQTPTKSSNGSNISTSVTTSMRKPTNASQEDCRIYDSYSSSDEETTPYEINKDTIQNMLHKVRLEPPSGEPKVMTVNRERKDKVVTISETAKSDTKGHDQVLQRTDNIMTSRDDEHNRQVEVIPNKEDHELPSQNENVSYPSFSDQIHDELAVDDSLFDVLA